MCCSSLAQQPPVQGCSSSACQAYHEQPPGGGNVKRQARLDCILDVVAHHLGRHSHIVISLHHTCVTWHHYATTSRHRPLARLAATSRHGPVARLAATSRMCHPALKACRRTAQFGLHNADTLHNFCKQRHLETRSSVLRVSNVCNGISNKLEASELALAFRSARSLCALDGAWLLMSFLATKLTRTRSSGLVPFSAKVSACFSSAAALMPLTTSSSNKASCFFISTVTCRN